MTGEQYGRAWSLLRADASGTVERERVPPWGVPTGRAWDGRRSHESGLPHRRIEGRIVDWFFTDGPITALVVVRIGLGLVAFCSTLEYLPHVHWLWSEHGFLAETS